VFDADPSSAAGITSEAIDPEIPLSIMGDDGNIVPNPADSTTATGVSGQKAASNERVIDAGHVEKCVTDFRELVCPFLQA